MGGICGRDSVNVETNAKRKDTEKSNSNNQENNKKSESNQLSLKTTIKEAKDVITINQEVPNSIDDYLIGKQLGSRYLSDVYSGLNSLTGEIVAIKKINLEKILQLSKYAEDLKQFKLEKIEKSLKLLNNLNHGNLIKFHYCTDSINKSTYEMTLVYEFCNGASINKLLEKYGDLEEKVIKIYIKQILECLKFLNDNGVEHKNLKSSNVLIDGNGTVRLADTLIDNILLRISELNDINKIKEYNNLPYWLSPEELIKDEKKESVFGKNDIWSIGTLILEMFDKTYFAKKFKTLEDYIDFLKNKKSFDIPVKMTLSCAGFLTNCLHYDPNLRPTIDWLLNHEFFNNEIILKENNISMNKVDKILIPNENKELNLNSNVPITFNNNEVKNNLKNNETPNFVIGNNKKNNNDAKIFNFIDIGAKEKDGNGSNSMNSSFINNNYEIYELNSEIENSYQLINNHSLKNSVVLDTIHKSLDSNNMSINIGNKFNIYNVNDFLKNNGFKDNKKIEKIEEDIELEEEKQGSIRKRSTLKDLKKFEDEDDDIGKILNMINLETFENMKKSKMNNTLNNKGWVSLNRNKVSKTKIKHLNDSLNKNLHTEIEGKGRNFENKIVEFNSDFSPINTDNMNKRVMSAINLQKEKKHKHKINKAIYTENIDNDEKADETIILNDPLEKSDTKIKSNKKQSLSKDKEKNNISNTNLDEDNHNSIINVNSNKNEEKFNTSVGGEKNDLISKTLTNQSFSIILVNNPNDVSIISKKNKNFIGNINNPNLYNLVKQNSNSLITKREKSKDNREELETKDDELKEKDETIILNKTDLINQTDTINESRVKMPKYLIVKKKTSNNVTLQPQQIIDKIEKNKNNIPTISIKNIKK